MHRGLEKVPLRIKPLIEDKELDLAAEMNVAVREDANIDQERAG